LVQKDQILKNGVYPIFGSILNLLVTLVEDTVKLQSLLPPAQFKHFIHLGIYKYNSTHWKG